MIRDDDSGDMNNVTSTKQNVNASTGIVVLAYNDTTAVVLAPPRPTVGPGRPARRQLHRDAARRAEPGSW